MHRNILRVAVFTAALVPSFSYACSCGCGVFDVGTGTMMPTDSGGTVWLQYNAVNQSQNWQNSSAAPKDDNHDKVIRSNYFNAGIQYMFNRSWGVTSTLPFAHRFVKAEDHDIDAIAKFEHAAIGDLQVQGIYSGFSEDMSTGIKFGLKLPTGDFRYGGFDRDTSIGTGSTDLLLGFYHIGLISQEYNMNWFVNGQWSHAFSTQGDYRPGDETNSAVGMYRGFALGEFGKISPMLQLIGTYRVHDTGINAMAADTGYGRLSISPGMEYKINQVRLYGDVQVPVYQTVNGNQLVPPVIMKFMVGYNFK
jgi:hypothetical protein